jgi:membrane-associated protease RseP (regulator of RpoE activity)
MAILAAILLLSVVIFVHEFGHFLFAKLLGVRVLKFSLGFGPKLIGKKYGDTEYLISYIPLGGYVKMIGENPKEELKEEEKLFAYNYQSIWKRFLIIFVGPFFNILFSAVIFYFLLLLKGNFNIIKNIFISIGITWELLKTTVISFMNLISGIIPMSSLGGPIAIVQMASEQAANGLIHYLILMAFISVNVAIVNLLPIPMFDGGHILFLGVEAIRKKPFNKNITLGIQKIGIVIILSLMGFAVYNDIVRLTIK